MKNFQVSYLFFSVSFSAKPSLRKYLSTHILIELYWDNYSGLITQSQCQIFLVLTRNSIKAGLSFRTIPSIRWDWKRTSSWLNKIHKLQQLIQYNWFKEEKISKWLTKIKICISIFGINFSIQHGNDLSGESDEIYRISQKRVV